MPPLTRVEALEVAAIHSIAGALAERQVTSILPPFVAPTPHDNDHCNGWWWRKFH